MAERADHIETTDLDCFLKTLAGNLRRDALAVMGFAATNYRAGDSEHHDLAAISDALERTATLLAAVGGGLCQDCQLREVSERVTFRGAVSGSPEPGARESRGKAAGRQVRRAAS